MDYDDESSNSDSTSEQSQESTSSAKNTLLDDSIDECDALFDQFLVCTQNELMKPYYLIRYELIRNTSQKEVFKFWMEMQKIKAVNSYERK